MKYALGGCGAPVEPVRIRIAGKQGQLEEQQTSCPNSGRAAEPGQDQLRNQRFDFKEKKGTEENGRSEERGLEFATCRCALPKEAVWDEISFCLLRVGFEPIGSGLRNLTVLGGGAAADAN